jgi:hypothetical protein
MFVRNPYSFPVTFTAPPLPVTASLDATSQRRWDATRATLWIVDTLRNPSRGESGTAFTAAMRPDWSNASSNRTALTVYDLNHPCGSSGCVNTQLSTFDIAFPSITNPADAAFGSIVRSPFPSALYTKSVVPTCFLAQEPSGLPTATSCTPVNVAQGIFTLAPGQFVVLSYQTSHTTTDKEFLAPGWSSIINDKVPVFDDRGALPNNATWDAQHPTFGDSTFLLHRSGTTTLTKTLLMVSEDLTPDLVCTFSAGCFWGRFQVVISGARLAATSTNPLVPVTGNGPTAQSWTASTIAVPSTFRTLTAPAP